jgi:hypothetical protein
LPREEDARGPGARPWAAKFGLTEHIHWDRVAFVTDVDWMRHASAAFGWMVPGKFKVFSVADLDAAKAWVGGSD